MYTCVGYSVDDMGRIRDKVDDKIRQEACSDDLFFGAPDIWAAVKMLKPHKNDMHGGLSSDNFVNAYIATLFNAIVVHGSLPNTFCTVQLCLFPKVAVLIFMILVIRTTMIFL